MSVAISLKQESIDELAETISSQYKRMLPGHDKDDEPKTVTALIGRETKSILGDIRDSMTDLVESFAQSVGIQKKTAEELERDNDLKEARSGEDQPLGSRFKAPEALVGVTQTLTKAGGLLALAAGIGYFSEEISAVVGFLVDTVKIIGGAIKGVYNMVTSEEFVQFAAVLVGVRLGLNKLLTSGSAFAKGVRGISAGLMLQGGVLSKLSTGFAKSMEGIKVFFTAISNAGKSVFSFLKGIKIFYLGKLFSGIGSTFSVIGKVLAPLAGIGKKILFFGKGIPLLGEVILFFEGIYYGIKGMVTGFMKRGLKGIIPGLADGLYNGIVAPILNFFKSIFSWFVGFLGFESLENWLDDFDFKFDLFGMIMNAMNDLGNWFGDVWDSLTGAVKEWWDKSKLNPKNWFSGGDEEETNKKLNEATEKAVTDTSATDSANADDPLSVSDAGIYRKELDKAKTSKKKDYNKAFDIKNYEAFFNNYDPRNEVTGAQFWHSRKFKQQFNALLGDSVNPAVYQARWSSAVFDSDNAWSKKHSEFTEMKMNPDAYPKTYKSLDDFSVDRISKTQEFVVDKEPLPVELESAGADDPMGISDVGVPRGNSKILKGISDFFFGDDEAKTQPKSKMRLQMEEKARIERLKMNKNLQNLPAGSTINGKSISDMSKKEVNQAISPFVSNSDNRQNVVTTTNNTTNMPMNTGTSDNKVKDIFLTDL